MLRKGSQGDDMIAETNRRRQAQREVRAKMYYPAYRFKLPKPTAGNSSKSRIVFLDASINDRATLAIHEIYNPNAANGEPRMSYDTCIAESGKCPNCDGRNKLNYYDGRPKYSSIVVSFSIIEIHPDRPYTNPRTKEVSTFSKRMLSIKANQWPDILSILEEAEYKYGTLRGVVLDMARFEGSGTDQPAIGKPQKIVTKKNPHGRFAKFSEETLVSKFGNQEKLKDDGSVYMELNERIRPLDYSKEFVYLDEAELCAKYGLEAPKSSNFAGAAGMAGAAGAASQDFDDFDDEIPMGGEVDDNGFATDEFDDDELEDEGVTSEGDDSDDDDDDDFDDGLGIED